MKEVASDDYAESACHDAHFCGAWEPRSALPFLDAMAPAFAASGSESPVRMAFVYVPNGMDMRNWNPDYEGKLGELPRILKPLEPFKDDITAARQSDA